MDVRILLGDSIPFPYTLILVGKDAGLHKDTGSQVEDDGEEEGNVTEAIALQQMEVDICGMVRCQALRILNFEEEKKNQNINFSLQLIFYG